MATEAERIAPEEPGAASQLADHVIGMSHDPLARAVAFRAIGVVARARSDLVAAEAAFAESVNAALDGGLVEEAAFSRVFLASPLALTGRQSEALGELERAAAHLAGERRVLATIQLGAIKRSAGDHQGALETLDTIRNDVAGLSPQRLSVYLMNRGDSLLDTHRPRAAAEMFERVLDLRLASNDHQQITAALHHLARAYVTAGMTAEALTCFRRIDQLELGPADGRGWVDRATVLLAAGLVAEAEHAARLARDSAVTDDRSYWVSLAAMVHAETLEAMGDDVGAAAAARTASRLFEEQDHVRLGDLSTAIVLRCEARLGVGDLIAMDRLAGRLATAGAAAESAALRLVLAQSSSDDDVIRRNLEHVVGMRLEGIADVVMTSEARARLALLDGDIAAMRETIDTAMRELALWRAAIGSTELRATTARLSAPLSDLVIADAFGRGDPIAVLEAVEQVRLSSVISSPPRPDDPEFDLLLARLRSLTVDRDTPNAGERSLIETEIRDLSRIRGGSTAKVRELDLDHVITQLGDVALVEFVEQDGALAAVVVDGAPRLVHFGSVNDLAGEIDSLRFAMERLSSAVGSRASREAFATVMNAAANHLGSALIEPLGLDPDLPLVVVPSSSVSALPWAALELLRSRTFSVSPSVQLRFELADQPGGRGALAVGIEDPPSAMDEARSVAGLLGCQTLLGSSATVASVLAAMDGIEIAHLACHGRFRSDSPLMSSVAMSDGPLTVYDIERLGNPPTTVVMSACEIGQTARRMGEGLMGMSASMMAAGTQSVVAAGTAVSDQATARFMVEFHGARSGGRPSAQALAHARLETGDDFDTRIVGSSFLCFGV